jgi:hypothetical protein
MPQAVNQFAGARNVMHFTASGASIQRHRFHSTGQRAAGTLTMPDARRLAERWRRRFRGRSFSDSTRLIREDRDSR